MDYFINMLSILLLQILWTLKNIYERYLYTGREVCESTAETSTIDHTSSRHSSENSTKLLFYPVYPLGKRKEIHTNLNDVFSPDEEEMLRYLCAKGFPKSTKVSNIFTYTNPPKLKRLPRSTYTAIWLDSCMRQ